MMISRRTLIAAGVMMAFAAPALASDTKKPVKRLTADVVVVGSGSAGMAAAASAAENGARVVIFEKLLFIGGSSALSGGAIAAGGSRWQKQNNENLTAASYEEIWLSDQQLSEPGGNPKYPDREAIHRMCSELAVTVDWLQDPVGHKFAKPRPFGWGGPNHAHAPAQMPVPPSGRGSLGGGGRFAIEALWAYCQKFDARLYTGAPVKDLLVDEKGDMAGVIAEDDEYRYVVMAPAVFLGCGGFARNAEMVAARVPAYAPFVKYSVAGMGDTGDGIVMATRIGAVESADSWMLGLFFSAADPKLTKTFTNKDGYKNCVFINQDGKRFVREDRAYVTDAVAAQKAAWAIVDSSDPEKVAPLADLNDPAIAVGGKDLRELAAKLGVNADNLIDTMADYNHAAKVHQDKRFGKEPQFIVSIDKGPFYAVRIIPQSGGTMGGIEVDDAFRALRADGSVIGGLYAGGEMANRKFYNRMYTSGSSLGIGFTSGRIGGKDAARYAARRR